MSAAYQAQAQWAATSSPLGTPKLNSGPSNASTPSGIESGVSSPSYFPRAVEPPITRPRSSRLPWADASGGEESDENPEPEDLHEPERSEEDQYLDTTAREQEPNGWPPGLDPTATPHFAMFAPEGPNAEWTAMQPQPYGAYAGGPMWHPGFDRDNQLTPSHSRPHTPTYEAPPMVLPGPAPGEVASIDFANELSGPSGLGQAGAYRMSPFDHLASIFASSGIAPEILEEALNVSGYDVDQAIEHIISTQDAPSPPPEEPPMQMRHGMGISGSRPMVVSRDSFDGYGARGSSRWGGRPQTPEGGRGVGGRVCRYYMAGNCLRSDCKFSHDVSRAVCK